MKQFRSFFKRKTLLASPGSVSKHLIITGLVLLIASSFSMAQERHFTLGNTHFIQMTSELTGSDHELIVFLPNSYNRSPDKQYPVLYFMDGYWDMPLLAAIHAQLVYDNVIPELIMVGFSYPGEDADYPSLRSRDLSPIRDGAKFLRFIVETVIPRVESDYRIDQNERALSGSSLGGLFTLYVMYENPQLFKRHIAISPATGRGRISLFASDDAYAEKNHALPARLFLSHGGDEYPAFRDPIIDLEKQIAGRDYNGLALLVHGIEGERHSGVKSEGYSRGLRWVFKDIAPIGPSGLERAFQRKP